MSYLDPLAEALFRGRAYAEAADALHRKHHDGLPVTAMARAHNMRSSVQAQLATGTVDGYVLVDKHLWSGRVEVVSEALQHYLLKARNALPFEASPQGDLFDGIAELPAGVGPLLLLLYTFSADNLTFATAPVERGRRNGRIRYALLDLPTEVGKWSAHDVSDLPPFDQGSPDDFGDLSYDVQFLEADQDGYE
ncbi:MAG TPA: hypothetical protein VMS74_04890 [Acidimicrobiia bacterium]|nr:hypothetical protein [Acidimicrobiia bacterium]